MENIEENKKKTSPIGIDATKGYSGDRLILFYLFYHHASVQSRQNCKYTLTYTHIIWQTDRITAPEYTETNT